MGIRNKIKLGFAALGLLLFIAGVISYIELARLNEITTKIINEGANSVKFSNDVLDAINEQDKNLVDFVVSQDTLLFTTNSKKCLMELDSICKNIKHASPVNIDIDSILIHKVVYTSTVSDFVSIPKPNNVTWYFNVYKPDYNSFVTSIKKFMRTTQQLVVKETTRIEHNAYRVIMQGIAALATAIVIIFLFFFLIDTYYIKPIVKITKGLKNYLLMRVPFNVTVTGRDEVFMLKEYIDQLLLKIKAKKGIDDTTMKQ